MSQTMATRREWIGLAVLTLPTLLLAVDVSVLYLALPQMSTQLGAGATEQLWIMDIYGFLLAGFLVTMGSLGDRIGRRKLLLIGGAAFAACSVVAAYSVNAEMLILARALLGVAGATLMPSTMALIRTMFPDGRQMARAIAIWLSCFMGGMTIGPLVGGLMLEWFWWGSAFLLGVPVMALLLILGPRLLPDHRDPDAGRLDLTSVALSLAAILPAIYGLKELARQGVGPGPALAVVVGVIAGVAFVRRQRRLTDPILDIGLLSNRVLGSALGAFLVTGVVMAGVSLMAALYMQMVLGLSPLLAGVWLIPQNLALVAGLQLAPVLGRRVPAAAVMTAGLAVAGSGLLLLSAVDARGGLPLVVGGLVIAGFGVAFPISLMNNVILASAPPERAGSAAALSETCGELGIALGVATLGTLGTAVYRGQLAGDVSSEVPGEAVAAAREGIAGAVGAATRLPAELAAPLLGAARDAFATAVAAVGAVGGLALVATAVFTAVTLRRPSRPASTEEVGLEAEQVAA
jgi:MFS transporter, DHA2 family, multidrug resistance protein